MSPDQDAPAAAPAKKGLPTWAIVLIVCGGLAIPCGAGLVATVAIVVPRMQEQSKRTRCMNNLHVLGQQWLVAEMSREGKSPRRSGSAIWLGFRKDGDIKRGDETWLLCPADSILFPETDADRRAWDDVDLSRAPRNLCSYAGRDFEAFPIDTGKGVPEAIGACLNHRGGAVVVFSNSRCEFMTTDELGFEGDDERRVGPDSQSMLLRTLRFGDGSWR